MGASSAALQYSRTDPTPKIIDLTHDIIVSSGDLKLEKEIISDGAVEPSRATRKRNLGVVQASECSCGCACSISVTDMVVCEAIGCSNLIRPTCKNCHRGRCTVHSNWKRTDIVPIPTGMKIERADDKVIKSLFYETVYYLTRVKISQTPTAQSWLDRFFTIDQETRNAVFRIMDILPKALQSLTIPQMRSQIHCFEDPQYPLKLEVACDDGNELVFDHSSPITKSALNNSLTRASFRSLRCRVEKGQELQWRVVGDVCDIHFSLFVTFNQV